MIIVDQMDEDTTSNTLVKQPSELELEKTDMWKRNPPDEGNIGTFVAETQLDPGDVLRRI